MHGTCHRDAVRRCGSRCAGARGVPGGGDPRSERLALGDAEQRVAEPLADLAIARADGSYGAALSRLAKLDVLVLDDLLIAPLKDTERRDLLEVLEDRYDQKSTVVTSQVPTKTWHEMLADPTVADAICDRLVHNAHVLSLKGASIRKKKGLAS